MYNEKKKKPHLLKGQNLRATILLIVFIALALVLTYRLFSLQIIEGENYLNNFALRIRKTKTLSSTRGEIYDRNGELLAYNKLSYVVTFEDNGSYDSTHERNLTINSVLYKTMQIVESHGDTLHDSFSIGLNDAGEYVYTARGFNLSRFKADLFGKAYIDDLTDEQRDISAPDLMTLLASSKYYGLEDEKITPSERQQYGLPESYTKEELLKMIGMRAALAQNSFQRYNSTTIAKNVSETTVSQLLERTADLPGIDVEEDYLRVYNDAEYFSQIIGYTGQVSGEELEELKKEDDAYTSGDIVGKVGLEQVMETSLHGNKGTETIYVDNVGRTLSVESRQEPKAGNSLYLTLDKNLQKAAYDILEQYIAGILWSNIIDTDSVNTEWLESSDDVRIPVYDVYFSLFENNVLDVAHLSTADASANEQNVYALFQQKSADVFANIKDQLMRSDPTPYRELTEEMKVYESYIVNTMLPEAGILNTEAIDESDLTYKAWAEEETISLQEFLTYAIAQNWIDINGLMESTAYMDSDEVYSALADYIQQYLSGDTDFTKRVFRYMLQDGTLSGTQVCLLLFDQGILTMNETDYNALSSGTYTAYDFIRDKIYNLEITPAQLALTPCSGSVVITDPSSGDVAACVSYPGYDNNRLVNEMDTAYYNKLVTDLSSPFYSRATQEVLAPGSTFKPVTAAAGVTEGQVGIDEGVQCTGEFDEVDPAIKCWIYPGFHGTETLTTALRDSCNFYFNTLGYRLSTTSGTYDDDTGIAALTKYASMFGFDARSGVEVPETAPKIATQDAVRAAMGQSNNAYTVTQIARYVTSIANSGTTYDLTLIDRVTDNNGNTISDDEPVVHSTVDIAPELWNAIHSGMRAVVQQNSAFTDYTGVEIAGKTGTAQETTLKPNHALFIGYAPYDDPKMAITVRIANGYTSKNAASVAKDIVSYYFKTDSEENLISGKAIAVSTDNSVAD